VNAPLNTNPRPITQGAIALLLVSEMPELVSRTQMTPLEADIAREEAEAHAKRTATPWEVFQTLKQSKHRHRRVTQEMAVARLSKWEFPEEQRQVVHLNAPYEMKLFKGPDGFIVKWSPVLRGNRVDSLGVTWELFELVR
jgi:hypothetical protein